MLPFLLLLALHAVALLRAFAMPPSALRDALVTLGAFWLQMALGMMFHNGRFIVSNPTAYWMWISGTMLCVGVEMARATPARPAPIARRMAARGG